MKKSAILFSVILLMGVIACNKKKTTNLAPIAPLGATCPAGSVLLPSGVVLPQGTCPVGQGQNPSGACETGTTCQAANAGILPNSRYFDTLTVNSSGSFKDLLNDNYTQPYKCYRDGPGIIVFGDDDCKNHVSRLEILIESINTAPIGFNSVSTAMVTILAGHVPLWFSMNTSYHNFNNNLGFELRSSNSFRVSVENGHLGDDRFLVKLYYRNDTNPFAEGWVSSKPLY